MWPNSQETFTEEILNGKLHFLCSLISFIRSGVWLRFQNYTDHIFNLFHASVPFLYPLKTSENLSSRSSHQKCSLETVVLKNFTKFTGKHLCQSLCFNKVAGFWCFTVNFAKFLRTPSFIEHSYGCFSSSSDVFKG